MHTMWLTSDSDIEANVECLVLITNVKLSLANQPWLCQCRGVLTRECELAWGYASTRAGLRQSVC